MIVIDPVYGRYRDIMGYRVKVDGTTPRWYLLVGPCLNYLLGVASSSFNLYPVASDQIVLSKGY